MLRRDPRPLLSAPCPHRAGRVPWRIGCQHKGDADAGADRCQAADGAGPPSPPDEPRAGSAVPGRAYRAELHLSARAAGRDDPVRAHHRPPGQRGIPGAVRPVPHRRRLRRRGPGGSRADHRADGVLPDQGEEPDRPRPGAVRSLRRGGPRHAARAGHLARCRPQDRQSRARRRLRQAGHHGGHARGPAGAAVWLDSADRPGQDRARRRRATAPGGLDRGFPPADLARPSRLSSSPARVWCLRHRPVVPVVRPGSDR